MANRNLDHSLQVSYGALLSKACPHCALALLGEVPPWGVMLRLGDHACCQLLCNVRAELSRSIPDQCRLTKDGRAPPHQGRPREKREGGGAELNRNELGKSTRVRGYIGRSSGGGLCGLSVCYTCSTRTAFVWSRLDTLVRSVCSLPTTPSFLAVLLC